MTQEEREGKDLQEEGEANKGEHRGEKENEEETEEQKRRRQYLEDGAGE